MRIHLIVPDFSVEDDDADADDGWHDWLPWHDWLSRQLCTKYQCEVGVEAGTALEVAVYGRGQDGVDLEIELKENLLDYWDRFRKREK